jgi:TRAP-type C4-dicarboxylate transport system substrate-binding protein
MWDGKRPIRTPDDLKGLKMRVQPSKIQRDTYEAFGAIPTPIAFSEVYTALQTGVVDGADHAPVDMLELKMYQVTKYLTLTRHFSIIGVLIVGQKFMNKLTDADKEIVRAAGKAAADAQVTAVLGAEKDALATLQAKGIKIFDMADPKAFVEKVQPVYKNNEARVSAELIKLARETT